MVNVRITEISKVDDHYTIKLGLTIMDSTICINIDNVSRAVHNVEVKLRNNILYIDLIDESGKGFASCVIDLSHIHRKCLYCRSLTIPSQ
ncbi:MAG: hypothetical protein QW101_05475 [Ignisphaera sp.]|uniref:DUF2283 domain-containing protein n=1 Tax=Ignisphaera aggregans TaxID=334771 RepID=A0A7J3MXQ8_9CREN